MVADHPDKTDTPKPAPAFLTIKQVAERLNISQFQVYKLCDSGRLAFLRFGTRGGTRVSEEQLAEFIKRSTTPATAKPNKKK